MFDGRLLAITLAILAGACGDGAATPSDGGGTDSASSGTHGVVDSSGGADESGTGAGGSGTAGATSGVADEYCEQADAFLGECAASLDMCTQVRLRNCTQIATLERDEFVVARQACGFPDDCGALGGFAEQLCIFESTQEVTPTASQAALADDLCAACLPDDASCVEGFWFRPEPQEGAAVVGGIGASFLPLSDDVVVQLATECAPVVGDSSCLQSFYTCLGDQLEALQPAEVTEACTLVGPE